MSLQSLEMRLEFLEQEVNALRRLLAAGALGETQAERAERVWRQSRADQVALNQITEEVFAKVGWTGPPDGLEQLRRMMLACGVRPEACEFSREILAMREE